VTLISRATFVFFVKESCLRANLPPAHLHTFGERRGQTFVSASKFSGSDSNEACRGKSARLLHKSGALGRDGQTCCQYDDDAFYLFLQKQKLKKSSRDSVGRSDSRRSAEVRLDIAQNASIRGMRWFESLRRLHDLSQYPTK